MHVEHVRLLERRERRILEAVAWKVGQGLRHNALLRPYTERHYARLACEGWHCLRGSVMRQQRTEGQRLVGFRGQETSWTAAAWHALCIFCHIIKEQVSCCDAGFSHRCTWTALQIGSAGSCHMHSRRTHEQAAAQALRSGPVVVL